MDVLRLVDLNDVTAGSDKELIVVKYITNWLNDLNVEVKINPIDVISWNDLECHVSNFKCVSLPPVRSSEVYGELTDDLNKCEDKILITSTTDFPDNVWTIYNLAVERGARAVIFYDEFPGRFRRIVVTGVWSYSFNEGSMPPIPAVHLRREDGINLMRNYLGKSVELICRTDLRESTGYNIEGFIGGSKEEEVIISAHHDKWLKGFRDDVIGVYALIKLASKVVNNRVKYSLRIVSFTAEEFGNPRLSPWYWSYGSRTYVRSVDLSSVEYVVNLDTVCMEPVRVNATGIEIGKYFIKHTTLNFTYEGFDHPYTDGMSFSMLGIPTVTLHNLRDIHEVYHTDLDLPYTSVDEFVDKLTTWIIKSVDNYELGNLSLRDYVEFIRNTLPEELHAYIDRIQSIDDVAKLSTLLRRLSKELVRPVVIGSYRELNNDLTTVLAPHALVINNLRKGKRVPIRIPGFEVELCCNSGPPVEEYLKYLRELLEELINEINKNT